MSASVSEQLQGKIVFGNAREPQPHEPTAILAFDVPTKRIQFCLRARICFACIFVCFSVGDILVLLRHGRHATLLSRWASELLRRTPVELAAPEGVPRSCCRGSQLMLLLTPPPPPPPPAWLSSVGPKWALNSSRVSEEPRRRPPWPSSALRAGGDNESELHVRARTGR